jgi:Carboxypeptidase regulatory-like domain
MGKKAKLLSSVCACIVAATFTLGVVFGQDYRARVQGAVTDPSEAGIANARVTLRNVNTGIESVKETDASGRYLFDFVQPGTYAVSVEAAGFSRYIQENITVLTKSDVTVNARLPLGGVAEIVNVSAEALTVQSNTSSLSTTIVGEMLKDIPVLARNPFTLTLLDPAVVNRYWDVSHRNPFYMWSSGGLDVGGATAGKNDILLDGVPLGVSARGSYNLPMDAVQEVAVQQNAVDAEYGFSAGGILNLSMKSGTNDFHGTAYYFGRNPALNAMTNRVTRENSVIRNHIWGGTVGGPVIKNRLFFFGAYEQWRSTQPATNISTVPTERERNGDFSQSYTPDGQLRKIYDPLTTMFDPLTGIVTREQFPGNIIPRDRIDPTGQKILNDLWKPNNMGNDLTGVDNFKTTYAWWLKYWNISVRTDYHINEKLRLFTRFSKFETRLDNPNYTGTIAGRSDNGGLMDALNAAADVVYMITSNTTLNFRYGATYVEDDYDSQWAKVPESIWGDFWPNGWYKPVLDALPGIYYPNFNFSGVGSVSTGIGGWWIVHGRSHNYQVNLAHDRGVHRIKAGQTLRYSYDQNGSPGPGGFNFSAINTASTFLNPDLRQSGNMFASALLGYVHSATINIKPLFDTRQQQWALYFQDDIKLGRRVTLNLGLRYEYETAPLEKQRMLSRYLDLNNPIPEFQNNQPVMPSQVTAIANIPYQYNGAWVFTDDKNLRLYSAQKNVFLPRAGIAIRINDRTAFRAGFARYAVPLLNAHPEGVSLPMYGYSQSSFVLEPLEGKPRTIISDPFPAGNPLRVPVGDGYGRYTNLGDSASWYNQNLRTPINDRINFSFQRQLPFQILTDTTFFMHFGRDIVGAGYGGGNYGRPMNLMDPNLAYQYKAAIDEAVPNPFYQILPAEKFPGPLRTQETVAVRDLLKPYPQYGSLTEEFMPGWKNRYYAIQFKAERRFANGISFIFGYNFNREKRSNWFNAIDVYENRLTMMGSLEPRHNIRVAGTWELPFGKNRKYLSKMHPILEAVIGGWATSSIFMKNTGPLLSFGQAIVNGDPKDIANRSLSQWFNTSAFQIPEPYTPRTNPIYYNGLRGPGFWSLDSTLVKYFPITERVKLEFRVEFYNTTNSFMPAAINTSVGSANFGKSIGQANYGREIQYTARIRF